MIELPLVFVAGLLGSSHCIGMCGPFAFLIGSSHTSWHSSVTRQLMYSVGRIFTYCVLGAAAGFAGLRLADYASDLVHVPASLSILAGCFLIYQGLATTGVLRFRTSASPPGGPCLAGGLLSHLLRGSRLSDVFVAGILTGFLPCGLVYGFLGLAASSRNLVWGAVAMAAFGLGTVPIMVATGIGGRLLSSTLRIRLLSVAAWCVVVVGLLAVVRGASFLMHSDPTACPLCYD